MTKKKFLLIFLIFALYLLTNFFKINSSQKVVNKYLVAGTGSPGEIYLYEIKNQSLKKIKTISTGYLFVHTVRIGDIYNNGKSYIIAGVSNSFFAEPYGCKVTSYDLDKFEEKIIDDVGDMRCKDLTIGDADNDGKNEIILGTHNPGIVRLYKWNGNTWKKEDLETNFIAQIDEKEKTNHRVSSKELNCKQCVVQTAVHIVKVADIDNDGKNEVIATISSPLELQGADEISFIRVYRKVGDKWISETIDRLTKREFRSITVGDIYNKKKNVLVIGIGTPGDEKGSLYIYEFRNKKWEKSIIHNDPEEKNMKGVAIGDISNDGKKQILLATGFPNAKIMILNWNGKDFDKKNIGTISSLLQEKNGEFNSMAALINKDNNITQLIVGGMTTFPKQKISWEGTNKGFIVVYKKENSNWVGAVLETRSILGMDLN